jgi:hypothetical protein
VAFAGNMLSTPRRRVLAGGALTFFLGDGKLNHGSAQIFETCGALSPLKSPTASFDLQRIRNPGHHGDRSLASFFAVRLHVENRSVAPGPSENNLVP